MGVGCGVGLLPGFQVGLFCSHNVESMLVEFCICDRVKEIPKCDENLILCKFIGLRWVEMTNSGVGSESTVGAQQCMLM